MHRYPSQHWHMRAEEARTIDEKMNVPECKHILLSIAQEYDRLAHWGDKHPNHRARAVDILLNTPFSHATKRRDKHDRHR